MRRMQREQSDIEGPLHMMTDDCKWKTIVNGKTVSSSYAINAVGMPCVEDGYILIKAILDSGAVDHVHTAA